MTDEKMTHEKLTQNFSLLHSNPSEYLRMAEQLVSQDPSDSNAYFSRHQAWLKLGKHDLALADLHRSLQLEKHYISFQARGKVLRIMGRFQEAIDDFNRSEAMDPEKWKGGFGPLFRADCYARLGDVERALADCLVLRDDHWTPGPHNLPAGTKSEVIGEIKYMAAVARQNNSPRKS